MLRLISPADMQASEKHYFETSGVPSIDVMERAAQALADAALTRFPEAKTVYIACGPGGNGGDGYACARLLKEKGKECVIFATSPAKSEDAVENARRAAACGIKIHIEELPEDAPDLWIDCIYGTGLSRAPEGFALDLLSRIHHDHFKGSYVIACDIPSGLNGQTGKAYPFCVPTDITVTFQLPKYGLTCRTVWICAVKSLLPMWVSRQKSSRRKISAASCPGTFVISFPGASATSIREAAGIF